MNCLRIRTGLLVSSMILGLAVAPAFAQTSDAEALTKKDAPTGRQRLTPRAAEDAPQLMGVPGYDNVSSAGSLHGFGPMSGNPLFAAQPPIKSGGN
jgi:hypothetical protein